MSVTTPEPKRGGSYTVEQYRLWLGMRGYTENKPNVLNHMCAYKGAHIAEQMMNLPPWVGIEDAPYTEREP